MHLHIVCIVHNVNAQVKEAENSYYIYEYKCNYSDVMLRDDYGFAYEYTYWDHDYIHNQDCEYSVCSVCNQTLYISGFHAPPAHKIALSCSKHICDQVTQAMLTSSSYNKSDVTLYRGPMRLYDSYVGPFALK